MKINHRNIEPSLDPIHFFEGQVSQQETSQEKETVHANIAIEDSAEEEALVKLEQKSCKKGNLIFHLDSKLTSSFIYQRLAVGAENTAPE